MQDFLYFSWNFIVSPKDFISNILFYSGIFSILCWILCGIEDAGVGVSIYVRENIDQERYLYPNPCYIHAHILMLISVFVILEKRNADSLAEKNHYYRYKSSID